MTPEEAIQVFRDRVMGLEDVDELYAAVAERMAIRAPLGDWQIQRCDPLVRLFVRLREGKWASRYVWRWQDTDAVVDALAAKLEAA